MNDTGPTEAEPTSAAPPEQEDPPAGLALLRKEFPPEQISKLPRVTCKACRNRNCQDQRHVFVNCPECKAWITKAHIHLDYVGHAEITARLLDADPAWYWRPMAFNERGLPAFDQFGGLWIELTVCGVSRYGYGDAKGKDPGGDAVKEAIGDALRNAAMRFGAALDLWAKSDLRAREADSAEEPAQQQGSQHPSRQQRPQQAGRQPRQMDSETTRAVVGKGQPPEGNVQRTQGPAPGDERWQTVPPAEPQLPDPATHYNAWIDAVSVLITDARDVKALAAVKTLVKRQVDAGVLGGHDREALVRAYLTREAELRGAAT